MKITEAEDFLCHFFETYNQQDFDTLFQSFVWEDCRFINGNGLHQGKEQMLTFWKPYFETKQETLHKPANTFVKENKIAAEIPLTIAFKEDEVFSGIPFKKGDIIKLRTADFYTLRDGKISEFTAYRFSPRGFDLLQDNWKKFEHLTVSTFKRD